MIGRTTVLLFLGFALWQLAAALPAGASPVAQPTTYRQMVKELTADQQRSRLVQVTTIGYSAKDKRPILLVRLGLQSPATARILVLCRQHGDEPSGTEGALKVINSLAGSAGAAKVLKNVCLYIVPMVNPDGATLETRRNGVLADLNRDWGLFHQPETSAVQKAVLKIRPEFILDIHSWDMIDPFQQVCLEGPRQSGAIGPKLLMSVAELQARAAYGLASVSRQNVAATTFGEYSEMTLAHRFFLRTDHIASLLFETGPGPNFGNSLSTRTALVESMLNWLIEDTTLHADFWRRLYDCEPQSDHPTEMAAATATAAPKPPLKPVSWLCARWEPLLAALILVGWLALKPNRSSPGGPRRTPARFRRLADTNYRIPESLLPGNRFERRRRYAEELTRSIVPSTVRSLNWHASGGLVRKTKRQQPFALRMSSGLKSAQKGAGALTGGTK